MLAPIVINQKKDKKISLKSKINLTQGILEIIDEIQKK